MRGHVDQVLMTLQTRCQASEVADRKITQDSNLPGEDNNWSAILSYESDTSHTSLSKRHPDTSKRHTRKASGDIEKKESISRDSKKSPAERKQLPGSKRQVSIGTKSPSAWNYGAAGKTSPTSRASRDRSKLNYETLLHKKFKVIKPKPKPQKTTKSKSGIKRLQLSGISGYDSPSVLDE